jgi:hypothetical protein
MPADNGPPAGHETIFQWDTLAEIGPYGLRYSDQSVPGKAYAVALRSGETIHVWRADDCRQYFCHGLTFGGKAAPGGPISPFSNHVPTVLLRYYELVLESQARAGDILVWRGLDANDVLHSAILTSPILAGGKAYLDYSTRLQTKNGIDPETATDLGKLIEDLYGESYNVFRRK